MGRRTVERGMARALYAEFSRRWTRERRLAGKQGDGRYRKPTFGQWHRMHLRDLEMMRQSSPVDVQDYLGVDPWAEEPVKAPVDEQPERGVIDIPIVGDDR